MSEPVDNAVELNSFSAIRDRCLLSSMRGAPMFTVDEMKSVLDEYDSLSAVLDEELSFKDLEMKIRDGSVHIHAVGSDEGGAPQYRVVAAILLNLLLDEENKEPPNYRVVEWTIKPSGEFQGMRLVGEIVKPGGQSSHEIRKELEAKLEKSNG